MAYQYRFNFTENRPSKSSLKLASRFNYIRYILYKVYNLVLSCRCKLCFIVEEITYIDFLIIGSINS